jgi:hypothetical protein
MATKKAKHKSAKGKRHPAHAASLLKIAERLRADAAGQDTGPVPIALEAVANAIEEEGKHLQGIVR